MRREENARDDEETDNLKGITVSVLISDKVRNWTFYGEDLLSCTVNEHTSEIDSLNYEFIIIRSAFPASKS